MIKKKICIVGEFGVGKTSLVNRYVDGTFDERYLSTIGVSIKQKMINFNHASMTLLIWDIAGEQDNSPINPIYLKGLSAYVVVCDASQANLVSIAERMVKTIQDSVGYHPYVILLNKIDLVSVEDLNEDLSRLRKIGHMVFLTSAKTGVSVETAFNYLLESLTHIGEMNAH